MKRRWMVLPLALGLTLTLAACGGNDPKEDLVGAWSGQVDVMDQVVEGMRVTAPRDRRRAGARELLHSPGD